MSGVRSPQHPPLLFGVVVQLVRIPACHAGGRGFESRPLRQLSGLLKFMLQSIRDRTQGWITGVIVFLVCAAFALWGIHSYLEASGQPDIAAKVNKQSIQQADLSAAYSRLRQQQQMQLGADFVMDQKVEAQLKKQALDQLVMGQVLVQAAMKEGYRISMGQVYGALLMIPAFQVDGHFSRERFNEMI